MNTTDHSSPQTETTADFEKTWADATSGMTDYGAMDTIGTDFLDLNIVNNIDIQSRSVPIFIEIMIEGCLW